MTAFLGIVGAVLLLLATLILGWFLGVVRSDRRFVAEQLAAAERLRKAARNPVEIHQSEGRDVVTLTDNDARLYLVLEVTRWNRMPPDTRDRVVLAARGAFS